MKYKEKKVRNLRSFFLCLLSMSISWFSGPSA